MVFSLLIYKTLCILRKQVSWPQCHSWLLGSSQFLEMSLPLQYYFKIQTLFFHTCRASCFMFTFLIKSLFCYKVSDVAGVPGGSVVKNPPLNAGDSCLIPESGRSLGAGNGNPLQDSCLENPVDRGAWWATVHGVTKSQTRLCDWAFTPMEMWTYCNFPSSIRFKFYCV